MQPSISLVVPVYNSAKDLPGCLESIAQAARTLPTAEQETLEIIVCDNWSDDGSAEIAAAFEMPGSYRLVRPEHHQANRTRNWEAGMAQASADWMIMLHADDLMSPGGFGLDRAVSA